MGTPQITIETITPERAAELLKMSDLTNRRLRKHVVDRYAADMSGGRWMLTGEPIIVNGTTLINGHHRLTACVQSGASFTSAVFSGADRDVYSVVDSGLNRLASDVLAHNGHAHATTVAAAARLVLGYRSDALYDTHLLSIIANRQAVNEEADRFRDRYARAAQLSRRSYQEGFNPSAFAAMTIILTEFLGDEEQSAEFMQSLVDGVNMEQGDPRLAMRRWVMSARRQSNVMHLSALIRCRNAYGTGKPLTMIRPWMRGTKFPVIEA